MADWRVAPGWLVLWLLRLRLEYPDRFPSVSPSLSRSSTSLDGLLLEAVDNNFTSPSSPPKNPKAGTSSEDPVFRPSAFTFTLPPNVPKFPQPPPTPPPRSSPPPHATVDAKPIRAQRGREKRQRCSSVGSVAASDVSGDGRVVMTLFKFPQEAPARKSCLRLNGKHVVAIQIDP
ncbi:hypothetical protein EDB92DRAFT_1812855 [Lactarius akahatsu]|uniref:Uncharacterized protein n=1 Tax=Lactarius akahatsu TaxID=416441 RepID=A0AAD4LUE8_9AGAM|nr:hypothetical protein EDB92DRAFT_1812855 [Lactarius akahatsu]